MRSDNRESFFPRRPVFTDDVPLHPRRRSSAYHMRRTSATVRLVPAVGLRARDRSSRHGPLDWPEAGICSRRVHIAVRKIGGKEASNGLAQRLQHLQDAKDRLSHVHVEVKPVCSMASSRRRRRVDPTRRVTAAPEKKYKVLFGGRITKNFEASKRPSCFSCCLHFLRTRLSEVVGEGASVRCVFISRDSCRLSSTASARSSMVDEALLASRLAHERGPFPKPPHPPPQRLETRGGTPRVARAALRARGGASRAPRAVLRATAATAQPPPPGRRPQVS